VTYVRAAAVLLFSFSLCSSAQRKPVVLVDGYHFTCDNSASTPASFGDLNQRLRAEGVSVFFLSTCPQGGRQTIEQLGQALGQLIASTGSPQVDLVTYSMGGLIARCYLSGKQNTPGVFQPPADVHVRKLVSIATPNFGALFGGALAQFAPDVQAREMVPGSRFLFDLATWNQNRDDLREVDAVAVAGNAAGLPGFTGGSDGLVSVTSASLLFARPDQWTRIVPYCHSEDNLALLLGGGCDGPAIAKIDSNDHMTWRIIESFLAGTDEWRTVGHPPSADKLLARYGGMMVAFKNAANDFDPAPPNPAMLNGVRLDQGSGSIFYQDFVPANATQAGTYTVTIVKPGPFINLIAPAAARLDTLHLAPGTLVSIYGQSLTNAAVTVNGQPVQQTYSDDRQINAVLPREINGYIKTSITSDSGKYDTYFLTAPATPAIFTLDGTGTGAAAVIVASDGSIISDRNPARVGQIISIYGTGLGVSAAPTGVTIDGKSAQVLYAGPAPNYPGLDQINAVVPAGVSGQSQLVITAAGRNSNITAFATAN
jgi:uncharacterized protein (TIGR03437 family)